MSSRFAFFPSTPVRFSIIKSDDGFIQYLGFRVLRPSMYKLHISIPPSQYNCAELGPLLRDIIKNHLKREARKEGAIFSSFKHTEPSVFQQEHQQLNEIRKDVSALFSLMRQLKENPRIENATELRQDIVKHFQNINSLCPRLNVEKIFAGEDHDELIDNVIEGQNIDFADWMTSIQSKINSLLYIAERFYLHGQWTIYLLTENPDSQKVADLVCQLEDICHTILNSQTLDAADKYVVTHPKGGLALTKYVSLRQDRKTLDGRYLHFDHKDMPKLNKRLAKSKLYTGILRNLPMDLLSPDVDEGDKHPAIPSSP